MSAQNSICNAYIEDLVAQLYNLNRSLRSLNSRDNTSRLFELENKIKLVELGICDLVDCGLDPNSKMFGPEGDTLFFELISSGASIVLVKHLLKSGANPFELAFDGSNCLAAAASHPVALSFLLELGVDPKLADVRNETPLMRAIRGRNSDCIKTLWPLSNLIFSNNAGDTATTLALRFCPLVLQDILAAQSKAFLQENLGLIARLSFPERPLSRI